MALERAGDLLRGDGQIGRGVGRDEDRLVGRGAEGAAGLAVDRERDDGRTVLGREQGRAGGKRRPRSEHLDRDAVFSVAPVHQQDQALVATERPVDAAQVAPRDHLAAPAFTLALEQFIQLAVGAVVADDVDLKTVLGEGGRDSLVVTEMAGDQDHALGCLVDLEEPIEAVDLEQPVDLFLVEPRQSHQLQDVAGVVAICVAGHPAGLLVIGRDAQDVTEVGSQPTATRGAGGVVAHDREPAADAVRGASREVAYDPRRSAPEADGGQAGQVREEGLLPHAMGRFELLGGLGRGFAQFPGQTEAAPCDGAFATAAFGRRLVALGSG